MTRRRGFGLRPRLLAALVVTSVVTLAVAALALLPPLQSRLTDQAATTWRTRRPRTRRLPEADRDDPRQARARQPPEDRRNQLSVGLQNRAFTLRQRTDARVIVTDAMPDESPVVDTDFAGARCRATRS